jgi:hypothetical protein
VASEYGGVERRKSAELPDSGANAEGRLRTEHSVVSWPTPERATETEKASTLL